MQQKRQAWNKHFGNSLIMQKMQGDAIGRERIPLKLNYHPTIYMSI